jgi:Cu(I)/Ag(I) efflux system membrane fusion protein
MKNQFRSLSLFRFALIIAIAAILTDCAKKKEPEVWYCPMHTHYRTDHAGNCPICGMALVKEEAPTKVTNAHSPEQHTEKEDAKAAPAATITVTPEQQKLVGIITAKPKQRKLSLTLQLAGQVAYEPEIYAAIVEYRQLAAAAQGLEGSVGGGANLTQSAVLRLRELGVSNDELQQYARSETAASRLITGSGGGKALVTLRLSEADLALVHKGMPVKVTAPAFPGKVWHGQVTAIGSLVDAKNRSLSARVLVSDRGQLTAQMAVTAEIAIRAGSGVSIERSAVLDTGARQIVFVKVSPTEFEPRAVRVLGGNDDYALVSGISATDEVAVSSAFLLDSEAKLRFGDSFTGSHQGH